MAYILRAVRSPCDFSAAHIQRPTYANSPRRMTTTGHFSNTTLFVAYFLEGTFHVFEALYSERPIFVHSK